MRLNTYCFRMGNSQPDLSLAGLSPRHMMRRHTPPTPLPPTPLLGGGGLETGGSTLSSSDYRNGRHFFTLFLVPFF